MKRIVPSLAGGFFAGLLGFVMAAQWYKGEMLDSLREEVGPRFSKYEENTAIATSPIGFCPDSAMLKTDFVRASFISTPSVVFIKTVTEYEHEGRSIFDWFFEPRSQQRVGAGSGVIFSKDGYIVTNNHVVADADVIRVTIGKKIVDAALVGADPSSDLAVIKVNEPNLPAIAIGSSDSLAVGEWVLAVGNPFNLTSTVTAGIVSAKGRNINILRERFPIESFIQTDAAINPGNSGGALVNREGKLIGINTAILSRTGSYAGYGFAVPVDIVKKVYNDIVKYGQVQKALTGAEFLDIDSEIADKLELNGYEGVIITDIMRGSTAEAAKLEKGDVIVEVDGRKVDSKAMLEEYVVKLYPGDKLNLVLNRENRKINRVLVLTNREGTTEILKRNVYFSKGLGASFESLSKADRSALGVRAGVKVIDYQATGFFYQLNIPKGFIITSINGNTMDSPEELSELLTNIRGRVIILGVDKSGRQVYYPYRF